MTTKYQNSRPDYDKFEVSDVFFGDKSHQNTERIIKQYGGVVKGGNPSSNNLLRSSDHNLASSGLAIGGQRQHLIPTFAAGGTKRKGSDLMGPDLRTVRTSLNLHDNRHLMESRRVSGQTQEEDNGHDAQQKTDRVIADLNDMMRAREIAQLQKKQSGNNIMLNKKTAGEYLVGSKSGSNLKGGHT